MRYNTLKKKKKKQEPKWYLTFISNQANQNTRAWAEKQAYYRWNCKPFHDGCVIGHENVNRLSRNYARRAKRRDAT